MPAHIAPGYYIRRVSDVPKEHFLVLTFWFPEVSHFVEMMDQVYMPTYYTDLPGSIWHYSGLP